MKKLPYILLFLITCLSTVAGEDLYDEAVSILKKARKESDYIMVDALLVRHLAEKPDDARALYAHGYTKEKLKEKKAAIALFRKVISINSQTGKYSKESEKSLKHLSKLDPGFAAVLNELYALAGRASEAKDPEVKKALESLTAAAYQHVWGLAQKKREPSTVKLPEKVEPGDGKTGEGEDAGVKAHPVAKGPEDFDDVVKLGDRKVRYFDTPRTWIKAQEACEKLGGHLAILRVKEDMPFLMGLSKGKPSWLGATDLNRERSWYWLNKKPLKSYSLLKRSPLGPDSPTNDFMFMGSSEGGKHLLGAADDTKEFGYFCEWDDQTIAKLGQVVRIYTHSNILYRVWINGVLIHRDPYLTGTQVFSQSIAEADVIAIEARPPTKKSRGDIDLFYIGVNIVGTNKWWCFDRGKKLWLFREYRGKPKDLETLIKAGGSTHGWRTTRRTKPLRSSVRQEFKVDLPGEAFDLDNDSSVYVKIHLRSKDLTEVEKKR